MDENRIKVSYNVYVCWFNRFYMHIRYIDSKKHVSELVGIAKKGSPIIDEEVSMNYAVRLMIAEAFLESGGEEQQKDVNGILTWIRFGEIEGK